MNKENLKKDNEKNNKKAKTVSVDVSKLFLIIIGVVIVSAVFFYISDSEQEYTKSDEVLANLAVECELGNWVTFPIDEDMSQNFVGETRFKGAVHSANMGNDELTNPEEDEIFVTHPDYSLIFYDKREVEIEGIEMKSKDKKYIYTNKIRCIGDESKDLVRTYRQDLMNYIQANSQSIFEMSGYKGNIEIDDIAFVNNDVVYITFIQDEEDETDVILLMNFHKEGDKYTSEMLAQYEYDEEGRVLAAGKNNYSGQKTMSYEYDDDLEKWVLAW